MKNVITKEQKEEIKKAMKKCNNTKTYNRLLVLKLKGQGKKLSEISEVTGYHVTHIADIISMYFKNGIEEITANKYKGNNRNISKEKEEEFLEQFKTRAEKGEMLEVSEIKREYDKLIGKKSGNSVIYYLLKRNNWRKVMPRSKNPKKASEEEIIAYKKNQ